MISFGPEKRTGWVKLYLNCAVVVTISCSSGVSA